MSISQSNREGEREKRESERERHRKTDRQTDRQTDREREREDRERERALGGYGSPPHLFGGVTGAVVWFIWNMKGEMLGYRKWAVCTHSNYIHT